MKMGPKLAIKLYRKPIHTGCYLHFNSNHSNHVKRGVVHGLISRSKVICEDQDDLSKEIKNIRHDLMPNEYPQEFDDSIIKPSRSNRPSDKTCQGAVIIPYVKDSSEVFRRILNRLHNMTIFKTKYTHP